VRTTFPAVHGVFKQQRRAKHLDVVDILPMELTMHNSHVSTASFLASQSRDSTSLAQKCAMHTEFMMRAFDVPTSCA
jgi:hypothetical protein